MTNKKTESVEEFTKRKSKYFKKHNVIKIKDIGREGKHVWIREAWTFASE